MFYKTWGRLLYDPSTPDETFIYFLENKYGNGNILFEAYNAAGRIPLMIASFWDLTWDFTLYSEGLYAFEGETGRAEFISAERLIEHPTLDTAILNIDQYTSMIAGNMAIPDNKTTPIEWAEELEEQARKALNLVEGIDPVDNTMRYELADLKIWGNLGMYFSEKIKGATALSLYRKTNDEEQKTAAIRHLENALSYWEEIVEISEPIYKEMPVVHLNQREDKYFHWSKLVGEVEKDLETARKE
jgi:hypothetical protein